jgi:hypothetical protein
VSDKRPEFLRPLPVSIIAARHMAPELFATLREPGCVPPDLRRALHGYRGVISAVRVPR